MQEKSGRDDLRAEGAVPSPAGPIDETGPVGDPQPNPELQSHSEPEPTAGLEHPAEPYPENPPSPLAVFDADVPRRHWRRAVLTTAAVVIVLGAGYVGAAWAFAGTVPRGTTVAGVEIGGQSTKAAVATLDKGLAGPVKEPVPLVAGDVSTTVPPADAGLTFDAKATVRDLTGFDLQPVGLWHHIFGLGAEPPVTAVDEKKLKAAVEKASGALVTDAVDGQIVFADGAAHASAAVDGKAVDPKAAAQVLRTSWLTAARPLKIPTRAVAPDITQAETDKALTEVAQPLAQAPISVAVANKTIELPAATVTSLATFAVKDSDLVLTLDGPGLVKEIVKRAPKLFSPSADARFEFQKGVPVVIPGVSGTTIDPKVLAGAVAQASVAKERTARVQRAPSDPSQSTAKLKSLGIHELISEFSTPLTPEPLRTANLAVGAGKITGKTILPGDTFSLTDALGPITAAAGFNSANVIVNGEHVKGVGGGLSQLSTTTYNAAYLAGFEDVEHQAHSEWFARYPEGREATLYSGSIDMRFKNTSPHAAIIRSWIEANRLHVAMWGTKYWTVATATGPRHSVVAPTTVHSASPTCTPSGTGNPGFTVTVIRKLSLNGVVKETKKQTTHYNPQNAVICDKPKKP
ncbi:VanW family protein [Pengzhenrongella sp.]|jgi:vancomycin resistance protein YoaR|uniref:VanW family protein n=1 Tax=Pengzhenrongella sp. TaxID=2888820 RepID=UPI002F93AB86